MPDTKRSSIAKKLIWMNLLVSATALLLACSAFIGYDLISFRNTATRTLSAQAQIIAATTTSAILFNDAQAAKDVLAPLKDVPDVLSAAVYTNGQQLASYTRTPDISLTPPPPLPAGQTEAYWTHGDEIDFERAILLEHKTVGTIYLRSSVNEIKQRLELYGGIAAIVLLLSMLAAFAVSWFFGRSVAAPIVQLATAARAISRSKNYASRVPPVKDRGELTTLIEAFNEMLAQTQLHEDEIRRSKDELELRVQERTAELVHAKEEVERTSKFKDQFLSTMSHELRTPLNAVLGFSEMLSGGHYGALNERQQRYVTHIRMGGEHLLQLINDILDISKIEAGRLQLSIQNVSVPVAFFEVIETLEPLAGKKSQQLVAARPPDLGVLADPVRFKQILMNLVGNAIKFTPAGGRIELIARQQGQSIRVEVNDSGPGIPPEEQQRIFEAFHRIRQTGASAEGTGLGLAITRSLVELHGGELGLESEAGTGSCFYFTLPLAQPVSSSSARRSDAKPYAIASAQILVVEDDPAAAQLLESQLSSVGYNITLCDQPQLAVEWAAELQPSAITLDIVMKPFNGWDVLSALKSDSRTAHIPVVVVTIIEQKEMGTLLGAEEYIVKPVERTILLAAIDRCLNQRPKPQGEAPIPSSILVVEDDAPTREFIAEMLLRSGYTVEVAADGAQAQASVAARLPELVVLDLILPHVSGLQLLAEWRSHARTADLPVLVLTSKDLTIEERTYLRENAGALFSKQDQWQQALIKRIQQVVTWATAGDQR